MLPELPPKKLERGLHISQSTNLADADSTRIASPHRLQNARKYRLPGIGSPAFSVSLTDKMHALRVGHAIHSR